MKERGKHASDLRFILKFQQWKYGQLQTEDYLNPKREYSFPAFLKDYGIYNRVKDVSAVLDATFAWIRTQQPDDVDGFRDYLSKQKVNRKKIIEAGKQTSLASKILFLNNPVAIVPIDQYVRKAVGLESNIYSKYKLEFEKTIQKEWKELINECSKELEQDKSIREAEKVFKDGISALGINWDIETIRKNRIADKLLWAIGKDRHV